MDSKKKPHLFYPIITEKEYFKSHQVKPNYTLDEDFFARILIVEIPRKSVANDRVWKKLHRLGVEEKEKILIIKEQIYNRLKLPKTSEIVNIKIYYDSRYVQVILGFLTPEEARDASQRYHRSKEHPNVCAHVADDIISTMKYLEFRLMQSRVNKMQSQLVFLSMPRFSDDDIALVLKRVARISTTQVNYTDTVQDGVTEMALRYLYLSDAFVAEMLLDGIAVRNKLCQARLQRNPVLVQHDLNFRVSLIGHPAEIPLAERNLISESEKTTLPIVGCSYFDCISCGNARLKLPQVGPPTVTKSEGYELPTDMVLRSIYPGVDLPRC